MAAIIAFYSRAGNNYVNGEIRNLATGNTEIAAQALQELTGADVYKIEQLVPYSMDYTNCIEEAKQDKRRDARPALKEWAGDMAKYDTVYLGYPNYWGTMPMAVFTFLEQFDFSGKTILPFCTHEGSGLGNSEKDIRNLCPHATVKKGLAIRGGKVNEAKEAMEQWIKENNQ